MPALTGILSDIIKNGSIDDDVCNKRWFRQISRTVKKYDNAELDYDYIVSKEPIILAQQLIGTPINDAMTEIQNISLGDDD